MINFNRGNRFDLIKNLQQLNISKNIKQVFIKFFTEISSRLNSTAITAAGADSKASTAMQKVLSVERNMSTINNNITDINKKLEDIKDTLNQHSQEFVLFSQTVNTEIENIKTRLDALENSNQ